MVDLIPQCSGVLSLAEHMKAANVPALTDAARSMLINNYDVAIQEREQWKDATHKVDLLLEAFGSNAQILELREQMRETATYWDDCARAVAEFLESLAPAGDGSTGDS